MGRKRIDRGRQAALSGILSGKARGHLRFVPRGGVDGWARPEGAKQEVVLSIGLGVDSLKDVVGKGRPELGWKLSWLDRMLDRVRPEAVEDFVYETRSDQVSAAGATFESATGIFGGAREKSMLVRFIYFTSDEEPDFATFEGNIVRIAEEVALAFAQYSVLVEVADGKKQPEIGQASPRGYPAPGRGLDEALADLRDV